MATVASDPRSVTRIRLRCVARATTTKRKGAEEDTQCDTEHRELGPHFTRYGEKGEGDGGDQVPGIEIHKVFSPTGFIVIFVTPPSD